MKHLNRYFFEYTLIGSTMLISVLGFWNIYFGPSSNPQPHHHLHLVTNFGWMCLLLFQLSTIGKGDYRTHRKVGLAVLVAGPLLVASAAMLAVHSARKGLASGNGDALIVQNVMATLELGLLIFLAFLLKRRRALHGALLLSTTIIFLGIALFFALVSFVPMFKIEGPETFYRFETVGMTTQAIGLAVGLLFFIKDFRNGWPFLLAAAFFPLNDMIGSGLTKYDLIDPLTKLIGSMGKPSIFIGSFVLMLSLLAVTALPTTRQPRAI